MSKVAYVSAMGSLMYAMIRTILDIAFFVSMVSQFQSTSGWEHWTIVKKIFSYPKKTKNLVLTDDSGDQKWKVTQTRIFRTI